MSKKRIEFELDGKTVSAAPGETLLSVARRRETWIPTLCHDDRLDPAGACRHRSCARPRVAAGGAVPHVPPGQARRPAQTVSVDRGVAGFGAGDGIGR